MSKRRKRKEQQEYSIPTFGEYVAENYPDLDLSDLNTDMPMESCLDDYFLNEILPGSFEVEALLSLSRKELKIAVEALMKDSSNLEYIYLAMKLREVINSFPL